jgi:release factor glutamine methyltransferase
MPGPDGSAAPPTIAAARHWGVAALRAAGIANAGIDVRRLMAAALGLPEAQLLARPQAQVPPERALIFASYIERRCGREPVSRILGAREFYGRSFAVSAATLDPRPDSETLIEAALEIVGLENWSTLPLRILDIGTGTGCLLLTLLSELPQATGVGTDLSGAALEVARANAAALGLGPRVVWQTTDLLENIAGQFHMLVSNPPYVSSAEIARLEPEVSRFDPRLALDGGTDGLEIFRRLGTRLSQVVPNGWIVLEVGHNQADKVAEMFAPRGADPVKFYRDVSGRRRCVAVRTRN